MAFFATAEDIPMARASWGPKQRDIVNPKPPNPPIKRSRKPRGKGTGKILAPYYHFVIHESRVKTPVIRKPRRVVPDSWINRNKDSTDDQLRRRKKPRRIPPAVVTDRIPIMVFIPPKGRAVYKPVRSRSTR